MPRYHLFSRGIVHEFEPDHLPGTPNVDANVDLELVIISLVRVLGLHPASVCGSMTSLFLSHLHFIVESRSGPIGTVTSRLSVYRIRLP